MNIEPTDSLCCHDCRNKNGCSCKEIGEECFPRQEGCGCDNCFYGRDALAIELIEANKRLEAMDNAVFTGSRVYGTVTSASDVDLVVFTDGEDAVDIAIALGVDVPQTRESGGYPTIQFKIDRLNLILESNLAKFQAWRDGTAALKKRAPVSREEAVALFKRLFAEVDE